MTDPNTLLAAEALDRGNPQRAIQHLERVTDLSDPGVWYLWASARIGLGDLHTAEETARRGLAVAPDHIGLQLILSEAIAKSGRAAESERVLIDLLNRHPENVGALVQYAALLVQTGDPQGAREVLSRLPPGMAANQSPVAALYGLIALTEGKSGEARAWLDQGLALDPESSGTRLLASLQASLDSRPTAAADHALAAAQLDPEAAAYYGRQARYLMHPLMAPLRFIDRVGQGKLWIAAVVVIYGLRQVLPSRIFMPILGLYLLFVVYTWVVPWLLRKWLLRQGRL